MKTSRLMIPGAFVVAVLVAPALSAADSTGKKKPFWNRLRQPKASAPAENPAPPPAETTNAPPPPATAAATSTPGAAQAANPAPGASPAATPNATGPSPAATAAAASTAAPAGANAAAPPGTVAPAAAAPAAAAPAPAAAAAPGTAAPAVATTTPASGSPAGETAALAAAAGVVVTAEKKEHVTSGNRDVDRIIARMRTGPIGQEPSAVPYLDLIGTGQATAAEMNDFASYIARKGLVEDACVIQEEAIELDPKNSKLWLNLGLLERGAGRPAPAGKAFQRAVELYPANGVAWYNLGVIQDGDGQYDSAIESFRKALTIDPTLGDPKFNPQAINNNRLLVVRLMLAQQNAGTRGLALAPMQEVAQQLDTLEPETVPSSQNKPTPVEAPTTPPPPKK